MRRPFDVERLCSRFRGCNSPSRPKHGARKDVHNTSTRLTTYILSFHFALKKPRSLNRPIQRAAPRPRWAHPAVCALPRPSSSY